MVHAVGARPAKTSASLQGHVTLLCEQRSSIEELQRAINLEVGIIGPLSGDQYTAMRADAGMRMSAGGTFGVST